MVNKEKLLRLGFNFGGRFRRLAELLLCQSQIAEENILLCQSLTAEEIILLCQSLIAEVIILLYQSHIVEVIMQVSYRGRS